MATNKRVTQKVAFGLFRLLSLSVVVILFAILGFIIVKGIGVIDWKFLTTAPEDGMTAGGIWPAIVGTFYLMVGSALFAFPVGVMSGIYMNEYAPKGWIVRFIRVMTNNLSGIPSIVFGLFGMALFVNYLGFGDSILAGSLTLGLLALPLVIRTTEEALGSLEGHPGQHARRQPGARRDEAADHLARHPAHGYAQHHHRAYPGFGPRVGRDGAHPLHLRRLLPAPAARQHPRPVHGLALPPVRHLHQRHGPRCAAAHRIRHGLGIDYYHSFRKFAGECAAQAFREED